MLKRKCSLIVAVCAVAATPFVSTAVDIAPPAEVPATIQERA
jgi:hypothetical protein